MGITKNLKNTTKKVVNNIVAKTYSATGIIKSPKELARQMIDLLTHGECRKAADILSDEVKKHINKVKLEDSELVKRQLADFERVVDSLTVDLENNNYHHVSTELEKLEKAISDETAKTYKTFGTAKNILKHISEVFKTHTQEGTKPVLKVWYPHWKSRLKNLRTYSMLS